MGELSLVIESPEIVFIGKEELEALKDIKDLCCFFNAKEKSAFITQVEIAGKCSSFATMNEDNFEAAFLKAREILQARGLAVLNQAGKRLNRRKF